SVGARVVAALDRLAGVLDHGRRYLEALGRVEAEDLLGRGHLGVAEGVAVGLEGVLELGARPADDRAELDEARPVGDALGLEDRVVQGRDVLLVARAVAAAAL